MTLIINSRVLALEFLLFYIGIVSPKKPSSEFTARLFEIYETWENWVYKNLKEGA